MGILLGSPSAEGRSQWGWGGAQATPPPLTAVENYAKMATDFYFSFFDHNVRLFWGRVIHRWKGVVKTFPMVYYKRPNFKIFNW
jgi:hypothetical protein